MIINVAERRREIALLRAVGATRSQVQQAVMAEAAVLGLIAALIAVALGLAMLALFVIIFAPGGSESVGIRVTWETTRLMVLPALHDWLFSSLLALIFGPLVAALAAYLPARQAAALNVVEATRSERLTLRQAPAKPATRHSLLATHYSPTPTPGHWPGGN